MHRQDAGRATGAAFRRRRKVLTIRPLDVKTFENQVRLSGNNMLYGYGGFFRISLPLYLYIADFLPALSHISRIKFFEQRKKAAEQPRLGRMFRVCYPIEIAVYLARLENIFHASWSFGFVTS
jgi:hypothetical protein